MSAPVAVPLIKFNAGEVSPRVRGRSDLDWYAASSEIQLNAISTPQGPATMRPGSFHAGVPLASVVRFVRFVPDVEPLEAYIVELTDGKARFWYAGTRTLVMDGSDPLELATPWTAAMLATIRKAGSRDVMWLTHPLVRPYKLRRLAVDDFELVNAPLNDGPYYPQDLTNTVTITASGVSPGTVTLTASSPLWTAEDVGRLWRLRQNSGDVWGSGQILAFTSTTEVEFQVVYALPTDALAGVTNWRAGLWSDRTGWPSCVVFHQERLFYGSNPAQSFARVDGSRTGDFDNFQPGALDSDPVGYVLASDELPKVRDLVSDRVLVALMSSIETKLGSERSTEALSPSNVPPVSKISKEGSYDTPAIAAKENTVFIQRYARSVHEIAYSVEAEGLRAREISIRADHVGDRQPFAGGTWQNRPHNQIWLWSQNGALASMTYTPEQTVLAMQRHRLGGTYRGEQARVIAMESVPGSRSDEVWLAVRRTVDGADVVHVDVLADTLHDSEPQDLGVYLDSAARAQGTAPAADLTIGNVSDASVTLTASAAVFSTDDVGKVVSAVVADLDEDAPDGQLQWRRLALRITARSSSTVVTAERLAAWLPASRRLASGAWRYGVSSIAVPHLVGEEVKVLGDGEDLGRFTVPEGGTVELDKPYATVLAGLPYRMILQPNLMDAGARQGTARTRLQRAHAIGVEVVRSGPFGVGVPGNVFEQQFRVASDLLDEAVPLFTGTAVCDLPSGDDERRTRWRIEAEGPLPVTVVCAIPRQAIGEAAP